VKITAFVCGLLCAAIWGRGEDLYVATPLTAPGSFTGEIEGPACDREGNVYAVSFARKPTIGRVSPDGRAEVFVEMPAGSLANGIRFNKKGIAFLADYTGHNILRLDPKTKKIDVFAHIPTTAQPNDVAISKDGTLWASDPDWKASTGQVWRIDLDGKVVRVASAMGSTNGIDVSPDGHTLYVNESGQRNVWAFKIGRDKSLSDKRLVIQFADGSLDGMRCDKDGNLYISRPLKGAVDVVSPEGKLLRSVDVLGKRPTNLGFGGPDGRTCYVTEAEKGRLVQFRTERPGLEWRRWQ
jgi:sugar lactone lactonase YvrE